MKKIFCVLLLIICSTNISYGHQAYQRKSMTPNFFMPAQKPKEEKLSNNFNSTKSTAGHINAPTQKLSLRQQQFQEKQEELTNKKAFAQIYDEYIKDAQYISKTKRYPSVEKIKSDFAGMNTNDKFLVP